MKRKLLAITMVSAMLMSSLSGCGSSAPAPASPAAPAAEAPAGSAAETPAEAPAEAPAASGASEFTLFSNKVEIDEALKQYAATYEQQTGVKPIIKSAGGGADYQGTLKAQLQSGTIPEIMVLEGPNGYELWKEYLADLSDQPWVNDTDFAYEEEGKIVGFPVAIEGYGLGYNKAILEKAGIDPATLVNSAAITAAFEKLESMKAELGLDMVVSMVASVGAGMTWVTGIHNLNTYFTNGLAYEDTTVIDKFMNGELDTERFTKYTAYVDQIFKFSDRKLLLTGNYDDQLAAFVTQKAAFIHQGNWIDPSLATMDVQFEMAYLPHAWLDEDTDGIFVAPPSWYVVNKDTPGAEEAKKFLVAMASTPEGHDYMVNLAGMVPAFNSVTLEPSGQLSKSVMEWSQAGKTYAWQQYKMPDGFGMNILGPIYEQFATGSLSHEQFVSLVAAEVAKIKN